MGLSNTHRAAISIAAAAALLYGCQGTPQLPSSVQGSSVIQSRAASHARRGSTSPIKHLIIVVQQSRSFDDIFAGYPGADAPTSGCASGGDAQRMSSGSGCPSGDTMVRLKEVAMAGDPCKHAFAWDRYYQVAWDDGAMDGWNKLDAQHPLCPYTRVRPSGTMSYWRLAKHFAVADHMFASTHYGVYANEFYLIAGTSQLAPSTYVVGPPNGATWGCDAPPGSKTVILVKNRIRQDGPFPCFTQFPTMATLFDKAGVSWRYYYNSPAEGGSNWNPFEAIAGIFQGPDWTTDMSSPASNVLSDIANGNLADVAWVLSPPNDSDAPRSRGGPKWVNAIVAALRKSSYWPDSAILVVWDDPGDGLYYDNAAPPQLDAMGLGFRVPLIAISKYAKQGYVSHVQYEYGSILKFIEETWALPSLGGGATDRRANDLSDMFAY